MESTGHVSNREITEAVVAEKTVSRDHQIVQGIRDLKIPTIVKDNLPETEPGDKSKALRSLEDRATSMEKAVETLQKVEQKESKVNKTARWVLLAVCVGCVGLAAIALVGCALAGAGAALGITMAALATAPPAGAVLVTSEGLAAMFSIIAICGAVAGGTVSLPVAVPFGAVGGIAGLISAFLDPTQKSRGDLDEKRKELGEGVEAARKEVRAGKQELKRTLEDLRGQQMDLLSKPEKDRTVEEQTKLTGLPGTIEKTGEFMKQLEELDLDLKRFQDLYFKVEKESSK